MRLALECPVAMLELVQPFGDFDFILAKEALKDEKYMAYYKASTNMKIVDNSVNEEREPTSIEDLVKVFVEVGGAYLVSPDWIGDSKKTLDAYRDLITEVSNKGSPIRPEQVVGVVQGNTFEEALSCLERYSNFMAVPYDICSSKRDPPWLMGLRRALLISNIPNDRLIHLLGFNSLTEFFWYKGRSNVVSIDTGVPVMLGLQGKDILDELESKEAPTYNTMKELKLTQKEWTGICRNIALLRKYIS